MRSHLTLYLPLQALDDFLLLEESLLELIRSLGLLGGCPGHLAQPPLQQSDLKWSRETPHSPLAGPAMVTWLPRAE